MAAVQRAGFNSLYSLSNERFGSLLDYLSLEETAETQTISKVWQKKCIAAEPFIPRYLAPNISYRLSQRCTIPRPLFNLGPMYPLKTHEILDPKKCFSIVLTVNNKNFYFKLLYFSHATRYSIVKQHFSKLSVMIPRIGLKVETTILQFLDEISLHGGVSRVCKAWNYKTRLLPHPDFIRLHNLFTKQTILDNKISNPITMSASLNSRKTRTFHVVVWDRHYKFTYAVTPHHKESILNAFINHENFLHCFNRSKYKKEKEEGMRRGPNFAT